MLPPEIEKVLQQVQAHANYMPDWQMEVSYLMSVNADKVESHVDRVWTRLAENVRLFRQGSHCISINWSSPQSDNGLYRSPCSSQNSIPRNRVFHFIRLVKSINPTSIFSFTT
jgi:hypothetical protein